MQQWRLLELAFNEGNNLFIGYFEHHSCWWPGDVRSQVIHRHGIDPVWMEYSVSWHGQERRSFVSLLCGHRSHNNKMRSWYMYSLIVARWHHITTWFNIGSGDGSLPGDTKPLSEPILTYPQWGPVTFIRGQFSRNALAIKNFIQISQGQMYKEIISKLLGVSELNQPWVCTWEPLGWVNLLITISLFRCISARKT